MAALGIRPLEQSGGLLGSDRPEGSGTLLTPKIFFDCTLSADAAASFLAELRIANAVLQKTAAALAAGASGGGVQ